MKITLSEAVQSLKEGKVVGVPTETVYGLAASLYHPNAIEQIFKLKGRPKENPLIIHVQDVDIIRLFATFWPPDMESLSRFFWPGPLTIVLPVHSQTIPSIVRAGLDTAGFRIPNHPLTLELMKEVGPLVMPSANLSGRPSATKVIHVEEDFGLDFPILDGGHCKNGIESTILYFKENRWQILRLGSLPAEEFEKILGYRPQVLEVRKEEKPLCPGQLFRHYAPKAKLILGECEGSISTILGFEEKDYPKGKKVYYLGSLYHPESVAENLYAVLRQLDNEGVKQVAVDDDFPREGLWLTIAERLKKACYSKNSQDLEG